MHMKTDRTPAQLWKDYLVALNKLQKHELAAPTRSLRELHKKARVMVITVNRPCSGDK